MLIDVINHLVDIANDLPRDMAYASWWGKLFDDRNHMSRYDQTSLMLLYWRKGRPIYRRVPACQIKNNDKEPQLLYTTAPVVRVVSGPRRNRYFPVDSVLKDESTESAGIYKKLDVGTEQAQWNLQKQHDVEEFKQLEALMEAVDSKQIHEWELPWIYLTTKTSDALSLRKSSHAWFKEVSGGKQFSPENIPSCCIVDTGDGRAGYPFKHIYGKGTLAMDPYHSSRWSKVPLTQLNSVTGGLTVSVQ